MVVTVTAETRSAVEMMQDGFELDGIDCGLHSNTGAGYQWARSGFQTWCFAAAK
jgi:hypothetical protein